MRITRPAALLALLLAIPLLGATADDAPRPKSAKAKAAIKKHDRAIEKAQADFDRAVAAADKELKAELDVALKAAMKAGSLEEAKAIEAATATVEDSDAGRSSSGLVIARATFGVEDKRVDVTPIVRAAAETGTIREFDRHIQKQPDPVPGRAKTITVIGTYGGRAFELVIDGADPLNFVFGPPAASAKAR